MAHKPRPFDPMQRELRQQTYLAAPTIAAQFPAFPEITIELRFADPDGKLTFAPYKRIYTADMQAYFVLQCPHRDCTGGGFDIGDIVRRALAGKPESGPALCTGRRARPAGTDGRCQVELRCQVDAREQLQRTG